MTSFYMPLQIAPTSLSQPILPNWSFNLFSVNLGATSNAQVEEERQELTPEERDTLQVFLGDVAAVRRIKASLE